VLTANSSGLLTVIGDPATFIVANGIEVGFGRYLVEIAGGGLLVLAAILPTLPWLYRDIWRPAFPPTQHLRRSCTIAPPWCCC